MVHLCLKCLFIYTRRMGLTELLCPSLPASPSRDILERDVLCFPCLTEARLNLGCLQSPNSWSVGWRVWEGRQIASADLWIQPWNSFLMHKGKLCPWDFSPWEWAARYNWDVWISLHFCLSPYGWHLEALLHCPQGDQAGGFLQA